MKKIFKVFSLVAVIACCATVAAFAGCKDKDSGHDGEYHYTSGSTEYGVKVNVEVENNVIKSVKIVNSDYVNYSPVLAEYGWTQDKIDNWNNNLNTLLGKYVGKTVDEVMAVVVTVDGNGAPKPGQELGGLITTGATQSSGRLLKAVQDAIEDLASAN